MTITDRLLASAAAVLLFGSMGFAQASAANGKVSSSDRYFMDKAAQGGMAEVELGQLAEQNAQSQQVKDFGARMVRDHSKANDQLKQVASEEGVKLPTTLDAHDQATKAKLEKLHGAAFDKAYMHDMVMDHKKDVADFKHESEAAQNPAVKNFAGQTLPVLESHLQEAEKVAPEVGAGTTMGHNSGAMNNGANSMAQGH